MRFTVRHSLLLGMAAIGLASLAPAIAPAGAQQKAPPLPKEAPGKPDPKLVTGGTYALEPNHTQVLFSYRHFEFTSNMGLLSGGTGTVTLDPKNPGASKVSVEVPIASLHTTIAKLDEELQAKEWFDAAQFPTAKFVSTSVAIDGNSAEVAGNLTIHGVTKSATLSVEFDSAGVNPFSKKETVSFKATSLIKRSDFGLGQAVPLVGDEVGLTITAAFEKQ